MRGIHSFYSFTLIYILILATSVVGVYVLSTFYQGSENPLNNQDELVAEATQYPFRLIITLEKSTYMLGEPVNITWCLINIGDENITLIYSRDMFGRSLDFIIYDENHEHVYRDSWYYLTFFGVSFISIPPDGNITVTRAWEQIYDSDFVEQNGHVTPRQVPSGIYYIAGLFHSLTYNIIMETPPIEITIGD